MSATKKPILLSTLTIFHDLQDSICQTLCTLPNNTPSKLKQGLIKAHLKLSHYYGKTDSSPYYIWACQDSSLSFAVAQYFLVPDPIITYTGLVSDCKGDVTSLWELEQAKDHLEHHFHSHYFTSASRPSTPPWSSPTALLSAHHSPEKVDFTSCYE